MEDGAQLAEHIFRVAVGAIAIAFGIDDFIPNHDLSFHHRDGCWPHPSCLDDAAALYRPRPTHCSSPRHAGSVIGPALTTVGAAVHRHWVAGAAGRLGPH